ncbi:MAG TPA: glycosyltransferase family 2 protein [Acidimicrobiales bacterium]
MISVVMPAHNEEGYLEQAVGTVVAGLRERGQEFEVIIAENGSSDRTPEELGSLESTYEEVTGIRLPAPDYGRALRSGFLASRGDIVVNFDVDFVDLRFLDEAVERFKDSEVALVVGSKRAPGALDRRSPGRRVVTNVFSSLLRYGFGLQVSDTHGIKAMRRQTLEPFVRICSFGEDVFDTELILRAERAGVRVVEVPVDVTELRPPRTSIWSRIPRSLVRLVQLRARLWRERIGGDGKAGKTIG